MLKINEITKIKKKFKLMNIQIVKGIINIKIMHS